MTNTTRGEEWSARRPRVATSEALHRDRLDRRLEVASSGRLTLLTAPAGYGKSTAVEHWAAQHERMPIVTIRLTQGDGLEAIAEKLIAALATLTTAVHGVSSPAHSSRSIDGNFTDAFAKRVRALGHVVVVLDAFDAPANRDVVATLSAVLDQAPPSVHFVVTRRSHGPQVLDRLARRVDTTSIDKSELAFTRGEARAVLDRSSDDSVTEVQLTELMRRTRGWPFALHLAALQLAHTGDGDAALRAISGENHHIASLFIEEVLETQPAFVHRFLLGTAVLDPLHGSLCDAVSGGHAGSLTLRLLEHRNLFVDGVDDDTFSYHPLFRELLVRELRLAAPDAEPQLLRRAADWYVRHEQPESAARYLAEAEEWDLLLDLVDEWAPMMFQRGVPQVLQRWLDGVPSGRQSANTETRELELRRACAYTMLGQTRRAHHVLHQAFATGGTPGERLVADTIRAAWVFIDGSPETALAAADAVLSSISAGPVPDVPNIFGLMSHASVRAIATGSRARALWYLGDVEAARAAYRDVLRLHDVHPAWSTHVLSALALLEAWTGNLSAASRWSREALRFAANQGLHEHPGCLDALLAATHVLRERGSLARAEAFLDEVGKIAGRTRRPIATSIRAAELALLCGATAQHERGLEAIAAARSVDEEPPPRIVDERMTSAEIGLLIAAGQIDKARSIVEPLERPLPSVIASRALELAVAARDLDAAQHELGAWRPLRFDIGARLDRAWWQCIVEFEGGRRGPATRAAASLLADGHALGYTRLFLDAGEPAERLLRAIDHGRPGTVAGRLLRSSSGARANAARVGLSRRELDVIRYLPSPLSNAEIAAQLYVSLNTLKTHLRTIYRKLGVNGRREAIRRVQELGIA
jgi:LuxR family maltose regulon positive regulatory protein